MRQRGGQAAQHGLAFLLGHAGDQGLALARRAGHAVVGLQQTRVLTVVGWDERLGHGLGPGLAGALQVPREQVQRALQAAHHQHAQRGAHHAQAQIEQHHAPPQPLAFGHVVGQVEVGHHRQRARPAAGAQAVVAQRAPHPVAAIVDVDLVAVRHLRHGVGQWHVVQAGAVGPGQRPSRPVEQEQVPVHQALVHSQGLVQRALDARAVVRHHGRQQRRGQAVEVDLSRALDLALHLPQQTLHRDLRGAQGGHQDDGHHREGQARGHGQSGDPAGQGRSGHGPRS